MKLLHTSFFKIVTIFSLVMLLFTPVIVNAQKSSSVDEEERIAELAETLEFIYEKAVIYDEEGNVIGINERKIEEKYGSKAVAELNKTKENMVSYDSQISNSQIGTFGIFDNNSYVACVKDKLGNYFGSFLPGTLVASIIDEFSNSKYYSAAKRIIKAGFKGSAFAIAGELAVIEVTCLWQHEKYR